MHRRIHVARIERKKSHAFSLVLFVPNATQMMKRCFARSVRSPMRISIYRCVARDVEHDGAASFARRGSQRAHQRFRQPEWTNNVCSEDVFEIFALSVREQWQAALVQVMEALLMSTSRPPSSPVI